MALVKQHLRSDMRTIKIHSITSNNKLIQNYQTNTGTLYQQTKLRMYLGKFWESKNYTTKVKKDVSMKSWQSKFKSSASSIAVPLFIYFCVIFSKWCKIFK